MSASVGAPSFVFGVRVADGWVERSTSSGSPCAEGEEVGRVAGGGSFTCVSDVFHYGLRLRNVRADCKAYQGGFVCQRDW